MMLDWFCLLWIGFSAFPPVFLRCHAQPGTSKDRDNSTYDNRIAVHVRVSKKAAYCTAKTKRLPGFRQDAGNICYPRQFFQGRSTCEKGAFSTSIYTTTVLLWSYASSTPYLCGKLNENYTIYSQCILFFCSRPRVNYLSAPRIPAAAICRQALNRPLYCPLSKKGIRIIGCRTGKR